MRTLVKKESLVKVYLPDKFLQIYRFLIVCLSGIFFVYPMISAVTLYTKLAIEHKKDRFQVCQNINSLGTIFIRIL